MRIACDLDGTLADMTAALYREAEALFGVRFEVRHEIVVFEEPAAPAASPAVANARPAGPLDLDALMAAAPAPPPPARSAPSSVAPVEPRRPSSAAAERAVIEEHPSAADATVAVMQEAPELASRPNGPGSAATNGPSGGAEQAEEDRGAPGLTRTQQQKLWEHVRGIEDFWAALSEIEPGAVARLGALANEHQWEVLFLTQRPPSAGDRAQVQSQRWLEAHGFDYPSVFVVSGSRGRIADALQLDVVIDDRPEHCLDVALDSRALPILVWRDDPALVPAGVARHGIEVVPTFSQALARVLQLQAARRGARGGMLGSLKRALRFGK